MTTPNEATPSTAVAVQGPAGLAPAQTTAAPAVLKDPTIERLKAQTLLLVKGNLLPEALLGKPEAVMTILLYGHELGISPVRAINAIHVIEGRPSISANLMLTLVRERIPSFQLEVVEASPKVSTIRHRRTREDDWQTSSYTIEEATMADLVKPTKNGNKSTWLKHPTDMLFARNVSRICRWNYSDVLAGMVHTPEELEEAALRDVEARFNASEKAAPVADPIRPVEGDTVNEDAVQALVDAMLEAPHEQAISAAHDAFAESHKASPATVGAAFDAYQNELKRRKASGVAGGVA